MSLDLGFRQLEHHLRFFHWTPRWPCRPDNSWTSRSAAWPLGWAFWKEMLVSKLSAFRSSVSSFKVWAVFWPWHNRRMESYEELSLCVLLALATFFTSPSSSDWIPHILRCLLNLFLPGTVLLFEPWAEGSPSLQSTINGSRSDGPTCLSAATDPCEAFPPVSHLPR